jgi:DNA-binding transcriptional regulator YdaS (Cro superfamily)
MLFIEERKLVRAIADACQIREAAIRQWRRVPPLRVVVVERITGIPRHLIRPDVFPSSDQP